MYGSVCKWVSAIASVNGLHWIMWAKRMKRLIHIPCMLPTVGLLLILKLGENMFSECIASRIVDILQDYHNTKGYNNMSESDHNKCDCEKQDKSLWQ